MPNSVLTEHERAALESYVARSPAGTAYLSRIRIILLADHGLTQEQIAAETGVPITRVRQMLRAFERERLALFPVELFVPNLISPDASISVTACQLMTSLLGDVRIYQDDLESTTSVLAVHETRKSIRKLRTGLKLFAPYFEPELLRAYRRRFRKFMRRLSRSRDAAVFLQKLDIQILEARESGGLTPEQMKALQQLHDYWQKKKDEMDARVRKYLGKGKYQVLLADFETFLGTSLAPSSSEMIGDAKLPLVPTKTRHVAPMLIAEKLANVRAFDDYLNDATPEMLHGLRIQTKELRYTLEFFQSLMGTSSDSSVETVKELLIHLGDLNDARVHLRMLADTEGEEYSAAVKLYGAIKEAELARLIDEFKELWRKFDNPEWRRHLAVASSIL